MTLLSMMSFRMGIETSGLSREQVFNVLRVEETQTSPFELRRLQRRNSLTDSRRNPAKPFLNLTEQHFHLAFDTAFLAAFDAAKARIRAMELRYVEETDPVRQMLLEVYVAVVLKTPHNDFDNH